MICPNCKSTNTKIDSVSADEKEIYIYCRSCRLYSTLYRKGWLYESVNDMDDLDVKIEKEELKKELDYQNC